MIVFIAFGSRRSCLAPIFAECLTSLFDARFELGQWGKAGLG